jgi:prepilin signal peptidase PulO-like enzyme (type II secretory pathway)
LFFLLGLFLASFLNVVAERAIRGERWMLSRSRCDSCGHVLAWSDLIPVLSWVALKGRCRYCKKPVPVRYPLSELAFGIALFLSTGSSSLYNAYVIAGLSVLYLSVLTDLYEGMIYDWFTLPFAALFLILSGFSGDLLSSAAGAAIGFVFAATIAAIKGMGPGDATLLLFIGAWLGLHGLIRSVMFGSMAAGVVILYLLVTKKISMKSALPFAPVMFAGAVLHFLM